MTKMVVHGLLTSVSLSYLSLLELLLVVTERIGGRGTAWRLRLFPFLQGSLVVLDPEVISLNSLRRPCYMSLSVPLSLCLTVSLPSLKFHPESLCSLTRSIYPQSSPRPFIQVSSWTNSARAPRQSASRRRKKAPKDPRERGPTRQNESGKEWEVSWRALIGIGSGLDWFLESIDLLELETSLSGYHFLLGQFRLNTER